ncbi:MAG: hypothetical protein FJX76_01495 [Armatimonadetes bacterium]|nr:hypothetical protein [Armatimonadota bacterium]MBM3738936.1 hypothetical protein [Acidobacteriota bacterium]
MTQSATNPQTGETVFLVGGEWRKPENVATNDKGERAYLVGGNWLTVPKQKAPDPTIGERTKAAIAGVGEGMSRLAGLPVDTVENIINLGIAAYGTGKQALIGQHGPDLLKGSIGGSQDILSRLKSAGINTENPRPDDPVSRMLHTGGTFAGGSMVPGAAARSTVAAAAGGAIAGEALGPEWTGVGAMTPAAATQGAAGVKNVAAAKAAPNVETFKQAGTMPSVGQATDNVFLHGLENLAAKFPGGAGVMKRFIETQQTKMGARARTGTPTETAGRAIETGIKGEGGFLERTRATWQMLDDAVGAKVPRDYSTTPTNTIAALDDLVAPVPGAEKTTVALVNPKVAEIRKNLMDDLQARRGFAQMTGEISFNGLRALRSKVGSMLDDALVSDIPRGQLKKLYGALSDDLRTAAEQAGAGQEFARQSNYYRARMDRIESVLERVVGSGKQPEDIFKTFYPTDPDQANKVRAVMRSLMQSERQVVSEAVVNRLGRATPGKQNEMGEVFSSETFLTNWNKLSPGAKAQLFPDSPMRENVEKIAKAAGTIREGRGIYANPSGTAGSFAAYSIYASPIASIATGSIVPVAAGALSSGTAFVGAKMLTNPKVVQWLATPIAPSNPNAMQAHLARLGVIYNETKDEALKRELTHFVQP